MQSEISVFSFLSKKTMIIILSDKTEAENLRKVTSFFFSAKFCALLYMTGFKSFYSSYAQKVCILVDSSRLSICNNENKNM